MARVIATVVLLAATAAVVPVAGRVQAPLAASELAQYRLTTDTFVRFQSASRAIAAASRADPAFTRDPLFTREIAVTDDVPAAAAALERRLQAHPSLVAALGAARLSARDYTTFALALFAARLAHGFVRAGVLRRVPAGTAAANVAFVAAHEEAITRLLADLGIDG